MKQFILSIFLIVSTFASAQLAITVTGTPEDCPGQGSLSWEITGNDPQGTINYTVVNITNQTQNPYTTSDTFILGLVSGTYEVTATETITDGTTTTTYTASDTYTITGNPIPFNYEATYVGKENCINDAFINVQLTGGKSPFTFSVKKDGVVIQEPRTTTSTYFSVTNLGQGINSVIISDACGAIVRRDYNILKKANALNNLQNITADPVITNATSCGTNEYNIITTTAAGTSILNDFRRPIQAVIVYTNPETGVVETINHEFTTMSASNYSDKTITRFLPSINFPDFDVPVTATITLTDPCNSTVTKDIEFGVVPFTINTSSSIVNCVDQFVQLIGNNTHGSITITSVTKDGAPFDLSTSDFLLNVKIPSSRATLGSARSPLAAGTYTINARNECGDKFTKEFTITPNTQLRVPTYRAGTSCENSFTDLQWYYNQIDGVSVAEFTQIELIEAPDTYTGTLPQTFLPDAGNNRTITINHLPDGDYKFRITNTCGQTINLTPITLKQTAKVENYSADILERCGTFDVNINDEIATNVPAKYILMKYDDITGNWVNPENPAVIYQNGIPTYYQYINQSVLLNRGNNTNLQYKGKMRVVRAFRLSDFTGNEVCTAIVKEFTISGDINIVSVYAIQCGVGHYDVFVDAETSNAPLSFRIINKNGQPFVIDNGNNPIFEGLDFGVYDFEIKDACGNVLIRRLDITQLKPPTIKPLQICEGEPGSLVVNGMPSLSFEWYKEGAPDVILSTTNTLDFTPFNRANDQGTYYLRLTTPPEATSSCINTTLSYTIQANTASALAGQDQTQTICYPDTAIDLLDYIDPNADTYGTFSSTEVAADLLAGTTFFANRAEAGIYTFTYTVDGGCSGGTDTALITINTAENIPPVIAACPSDLYIENISVDGTVVNFPTPQATDNCKLKSIVASQASGTVFLPGTTEVVFTALDASGNAATCSFNVVVQTPLTALDDSYTVRYSDQVQGVGNILSNDIYNDDAPSAIDVYVSTVTPATAITQGAPVPALNSNGLISIPAGTPIGNYDIVYRICDSKDNNNCKTATISIEVKTAICNKAANLNGTPNASPKTGITNLNQFRSNNWLQNINNGYVAIDGIDKGMVITRNADPDANISNPVDGMLVWDTTQQCMSLYTTALGWHCIKQGCNE